MTSATSIPTDVHRAAWWAKHLGGDDGVEISRWLWRIKDAVRAGKLKSLPRRHSRDPIQVAAADIKAWLEEGTAQVLSPMEERELQNTRM